MKNDAKTYLDRQNKGTFCCMPVRWGLRRTTLALGSDKTQVKGSFGTEHNTYVEYLDRANLVINYQKLKKNVPYT